MLKEPLEIEIFGDEEESLRVINTYIKAIRNIVEAQNKASEIAVDGGAGYSVTLKIEVIKEEWA
jgi:hypothetical protein